MTLQSMRDVIIQKVVVSFTYKEEKTAIHSNSSRQKNTKKGSYKVKTQIKPECSVYLVRLYLSMHAYVLCINILKIRILPCKGNVKGMDFKYVLYIYM